MLACEPVLGNVEPNDFESGFEELEFVKEESFTATDIKDAGACLEPIGVDKSLGDWFPPAGEIFLAAVAEASVAVPVVEFVFLGLEHAGDFVINHASENIACGGFVKGSDEVFQ